MSIIIRVKTPQLLTHTTGWKGQATFFVNDLYTKGLKMGRFVRLETGTANGETKPVFTYAGRVDKTYDAGFMADNAVTVKAGKAIGFLYDSSVADQYKSKIDLAEDDRVYPYGVRQESPMIVMPQGVLELTDTDNKLNDSEKVFRATDRVISAANIIAYDGTAKKVTLAGKVTGIKEGEKVATSTAVAYTTSITFDGTNTVVGLTASLGNSTVDLTFKGVLFETIYLADDMSGDLPFTLVPNAEPVGKVVSAIAVEIDLR